MPHVTTRYRVINVAGHHRQPRTGSTWIEPYSPGDVNATPGTLAHFFAPPTLGYTQGGQSATADFLFFSAGDGTTGETSTDPSFSVQVGANPLTVVAWYLPEGGGTGTGTGYVIDAFSDALNDFVDDDFVTVTPDSALTGDANVVGWVPTNDDETLTAVPGSIHTGEVFESWIGGQPVANSVTDQLAKGQSGYALATYHRHDVTVPSDLGSRYLQAWLILFGIINDGPGFQIPRGGGGGGGPVGPWGPFVEKVVRAALVASAGSPMAGGAQIAQVAVREVQAAVKQLQVDIRSAGMAKG